MAMEAEKAWLAVLGQLQMELDKATFDTWVRDTVFAAYEDGAYIVGVNNAYARDWLESRLTSTVNRILSGLLNRSVETRFVVWQGNLNDGRMETALDVGDNNEVEPNEVFSPQGTSEGLTEKYTLDSYYIPRTNRAPHAAAKDIITGIGTKPQILFLFGPSGLGKTHLANAVGMEAVNQGFNVLLIKAVEFTNLFIEKVHRKNNPEGFRAKFATIDVLIIDDLTFLEEGQKKQTILELSYVIDKLLREEKTVVITAKIPPRRHKNLQENLISRIENGTCLRVDVPDLETKLKIMDRTLREISFVLTDPVKKVLAEIIQDMRTAQGILSSLKYKSLDREITEGNVLELIGKTLETETAISMQRILEAVCDHFGIEEPNKLLQKNRSKLVAKPRQIAMYLMREFNFTLPEIGVFLGGRDHTTIMYGANRISSLLENNDPSVQAHIQVLLEKLGQKIPIPA